MPLDTAQDPRVALLLALPPKVARTLALPGGLAPETLHITVAYLGRRSQLPVAAAQLVGRLREAAAAAAPLVGQVGGVLRFPASATSDGLDPFCAAVDLPGLVELREQLRLALAEQGVTLPAQHGYVPHIHLMALDPAAPMPVQQIPAQPVRLEELLLKEGGWSMPLPLGPARVNRPGLQRFRRGGAVRFESEDAPRVGVWDQVCNYGTYQKPSLSGDPLVTTFDRDTCQQMLEDFGARQNDIFLDKQHEVTEEGLATDDDLQAWGDQHAMAWYSALVHVSGGEVVGYAAHAGAPAAAPDPEALRRPDGTAPSDGLYALRTRVTPRGADAKDGIPAFGYVSPYFYQREDDGSQAYRLLNITATNDPFLDGVALAMSAQKYAGASVPKETPMNEMYARAGIMEGDSPAQKLEKLTCYAAKMETDWVEKLTCYAAKMETDWGEDKAKMARMEAEAKPAAGKETPAEEAAEKKAEERVNQAMERRLQEAEKAAAEAEAAADKLKKERQDEQLQAFKRHALGGPVESGGSRWPKDDEKGLDELIKDLGGDLDKAQKHVGRLPPPAALQRLTRGGNPAGAAGVDPPTFQAMNREQRGQTFSRLTREKMKADPKLTLAEAQQAVEREHPGLYTC
jgi:2'-5' RNA ligase